MCDSRSDPLDEALNASLQRLFGAHRASWRLMRAVEVIVAQRDAAPASNIDRTPSALVQHALPKTAETTSDS